MFADITGHESVKVSVAFERVQISVYLKRVGLRYAIANSADVSQISASILCVDKLWPFLAFSPGFADKLLQFPVRVREHPNANRKVPNSSVISTSCRFSHAYRCVINVNTYL
jgi:hypothetical protein